MWVTGDGLHEQDGLGGIGAQAEPIDVVLNFACGQDPPAVEDPVGYGAYATVE
jgi:hypothetical protein